MALLEGRNIRKVYNRGKRNQVDALRGVDVTIEEGEMVAITGPSGSGKSTLMHVLGLLHAPEMQGGPPPVLRFDGRDLVDLSDGARTRIRADSMGFVFQEFNLVPILTAFENVLLACDYAGIKGRRANEAAVAAMELVGLGDRTGHRPAEMSGGEQQRVALARALVNTPRLVLADEPTGNLDSANADEVLATLRRFNLDHRQTFVIVTHDHEVATACDRVIRMRDGLVQSTQTLTVPVAEPAATVRPRERELVGAASD